MIAKLDDAQIELLEESGKILKDTLFKVRSRAKPGVSAYSLDQYAETEICKLGGVPSFKNYLVKGSGRYPASLCVSVNSEVVHGLPLKSKILHEGDLLSLDLGVNYKGICSDMAITMYLGQASPEISRLISTTENCLLESIKNAKAGNHIGAISASIQSIAENNGFSIVRELVGHGIGVNPHMDPQIPNFGNKEDGPKIFDGMAIAIEPMITNGGWQVVSDPDGWTISTADSSLSAHFEHTVVIINGEPVIITA